ncbi:hypothetical protein DRO56_04350 [Candidatus Bathyarchaeota archaeon]|nr:MAG: hypothetical protein CW700_04335 [Candidatus Bathyarchaeota archaeon]RLI31957.1 MAG: hypothetical protein DRO56_04350 [Candidatus Bathyarchaeota archaeon]
MSQVRELLEIVERSMPFPPRVIAGYSRLSQVFTSGDLARVCGIPPSTAKFYVRKMVALRMVTKIPNRKKYQKYANAKEFSSWLKDLIRLVIVPLERGEIEVPE